MVLFRRCAVYLYAVEVVFDVVVCLAIFLYIKFHLDVPNGCTANRKHKNQVNEKKKIENKIESKADEKKT